MSLARVLNLNTIEHFVYTSREFWQFPFSCICKIPLLPKLKKNWVFNLGLSLSRVLNLNTIKHFVCTSREFLQFPFSHICKIPLLPKLKKNWVFNPGLSLARARILHTTEHFDCTSHEFLFRIDEKKHQKMINKLTLQKLFFLIKWIQLKFHLIIVKNKLV